VIAFARVTWRGLVGVPRPAVDGVSAVKTLQGEENPAEAARYLYWEFCKPGEVNGLLPQTCVPPPPPTPTLQFPRGFGGDVATRRLPHSLGLRAKKKWPELLCLGGISAGSCGHSGLA
jgi:hypothetical protein